MLPNIQSYKLTLRKTKLYNEALGEFLQNYAGEKMFLGIRPHWASVCVGTRRKSRVSPARSPKMPWWLSRVRLDHGSCHSNESLYQMTKWHWLSQSEHLWVSSGTNTICSEHTTRCQGIPWSMKKSTKNSPTRTQGTGCGDVGDRVCMRGTSVNSREHILNKFAQITSGLGTKKAAMGTS